MSIRSTLKKLVPQSLLPTAFAERELNRIKKVDKILDGPFKGMKFSWDKWDENFTLPLPKFLGCYEKELHPVIENVCKAAPDLIIDVGAADGYYAVGLALRIPNSTVIAFEELSGGQGMVTRMAELNGVGDRVESLGRCEPGDLSDFIDNGKSVCVMTDVEGFEDTLVDPIVVPSLLKCSILVECHDCYVPGVTERIIARFVNTHHIDRIEARVRSIDDVTSVSSFLKAYARYNIQGWTEERMFATTWLFLSPKSS